MDKFIDRDKNSGRFLKKHGKSNTRIYAIWIGMKARCYCKIKDNYERYGGRGITVCEEWKDSFENFYKWAMDNGYSDNLTLDRIDVNGNYCPENCRWITTYEQARNKSNNKFITYNGKTMILKDWSKEIGISSTLLSDRLNAGWSIKKALETPVSRISNHDSKKKMYEYMGEYLSLTDLSKKYGINRSTLKYRLRTSMNLHDAITKPISDTNKKITTKQGQPSEHVADSESQEEQ